VIWRKSHREELPDGAWSRSKAQFSLYV